MVWEWLVYIRFYNNIKFHEVSRMLSKDEESNLITEPQHRLNVMNHKKGKDVSCHVLCMIHTSCQRGQSRGGTARPER